VHSYFIVDWQPPIICKVFVQHPRPYFSIEEIGFRMNACSFVRCWDDIVQFWKNVFAVYKTGKECEKSVMYLPLPLPPPHVKGPERKSIAKKEKNNFRSSHIPHAWSNILNMNDFGWQTPTFFIFLVVIFLSLPPRSQDTWSGTRFFGKGPPCCVGGEEGAEADRSMLWGRGRRLTAQ